MRLAHLFCNTQGFIGNVLPVFGVEITNSSDRLMFSIATDEELFLSEPDVVGISYYFRTCSCLHLNQYKS